MPSFQYTAQQSSGASSTGVLTANSRADALGQLQARLLTPITLSQASSGRGWRNRVPRKALIGAYSALADLLGSGMPLLRSIEIVANQARNPGLKDALCDVQSQVAEGSSLASAMREQGHVFDDLTIGMIEVGEEAGFLEQSLQRIAILMERNADLRSRVVGALTYPAFLLVVGLLVAGGMFLFFVPVFEPLFARMRLRGELPWATEILLAASAAARQWWLPLALAASAGLVFLRRWAKTDSGSRTWDRFTLKLFGIGHIVRDMTLARFTHILGSLLSNGVPLLRSLELAQKSIQNRHLAESLKTAQETLATGGTLSQTLSTCAMVPPELAETIAIAEQSNRLDSVLLSVAERIESRTQKQLDQFTKLIEPMLMSVLAGLIGFLIVALLMPIFASSGRLY